jgi:ABC-type branched-subunit amino acid transport system substrate-binding protein
MAADDLKDNGISLYRTFYRHASSIHHMDIGCVIASLDKDMNAIVAPFWDHLDDALVAASSALRCVSYYDEMAQLGMQDRIRSGPNDAYVAACKAL